MTTSPITQQPESVQERIFGENMRPAGLLTERCAIAMDLLKQIGQRGVKQPVFLPEVRQGDARSIDYTDHVANPGSQRPVVVPILRVGRETQQNIAPHKREGEARSLFLYGEDALENSLGIVARQLGSLGVEEMLIRQDQKGGQWLINAEYLPYTDLNGEQAPEEVDFLEGLANRFIIELAPPRDTTRLDKQTGYLERLAGRDKCIGANVIIVAMNADSTLPVSAQASKANPNPNPLKPERRGQRPTAPFDGLASLAEAIVATNPHAVVAFRGNIKDDSTRMPAELRALRDAISTQSSKVRFAKLVSGLVIPRGSNICPTSLRKKTNTLLFP